jgi:voltage-gated potassium channel
MKRLKIHIQERNNSWNLTLLGLVVFEIFLVPFFPLTWHRTLYPILYSLIFLAATFTTARNRKKIMPLAVAAMLIQWGSIIVFMPVIIYCSTFVNILFFGIVVTDMVRQLILAPSVSIKVILESIIVYLLIGLAFTMVITFIMALDLGAFSFKEIDITATGPVSRASEYIYYVFITMCTVGYGDIVPLDQYARSIAVLMSVTGQFYMAIIISLLVGKYLNQTKQSDE